jgi:hypothetical protein
MRHLSRAFLAGLLLTIGVSLQAEPWGQKHPPTFSEQLQNSLRDAKDSANKYMDTFSKNLHSALHDLRGSSNDLLVRLDKNVHQSLNDINKSLNKHSDAHEKPTKNPHAL